MALSGYLFVCTTFLGLGLAVTRPLDSTSLVRSDERVTSWLAEHRVAELDDLTSLVSRSGDTLGAIGLAVLVAAALAVSGRREWIPALVLGLALELAVFLTVNFLVDRPRPDVVNLGSMPSTSSFPSGHTAAATVTYVLVACVVTVTTTRPLLRSLAWTVAVAMPLAVGFSRVYRGLHHPVDVLAGALIGLAVVIVALAAVRAHAAVGAAPPRGLEMADDGNEPALRGVAG